MSQFQTHPRVYYVKHRCKTRLRVGAGNKNDGKKKDVAIAKAYGDRFFIPLDFELLESHMPFFQSAFKDRLHYELTFNDYSRVVQATGDANADYSIEGIALEFEMVTNAELAGSIRNQYAARMSILYDRVLRHRKIVMDKADTLWNINLNVPARAMKGVLMLFEEPADAFERQTEAFYNPQITKVDVTIEGVPNQLYAQGMRPYQLWDEARKLMAGGTKRHPMMALAAKELHHHACDLGMFLSEEFALWLDLRPTDDDSLHGNGRRIINSSEGLNIQIAKEVEAKGPLNVYLYVIMDAQLNIENGRFVSAIH